MATSAVVLGASAAIFAPASPALAASTSCTVPYNSSCGTGSIGPNSSGTIWMEVTRAAGPGIVTCRLYSAGGIYKGFVSRNTAGQRDVPFGGLSGSHFATGIGTNADGFCRIHNS